MGNYRQITLFIDNLGVSRCDFTAELALGMILKQASIVFDN